MTDTFIFFVIMVYFISMNFVNDAKADEWNATYHNSNTSAVFTGANGSTLTELNDQTNIGYQSNSIRLQWSGANPPTASNGQDGIETINLFMAEDQVFQTFDNWTIGDIASNYYPTPPATNDGFSAPLVLDAFGAHIHNPEVLTGSYTVYPTYYPTSHFVTSISELVSYMNDYMTYLTANPPAGNEGYTYGPLAAYANGRSYYIVTQPSGSSFQSYLSIGYANCTAGYAMSGTLLEDLSCDLSNANSVQFPDDGICEAKLTNGEFVYTSRDKDCSKLAPTGLGTSNTNASETVIASTPTKTLYIVSSASGTISAYEKTYDGDNDQTQTLIGNIFSDQTFNYLQELNTSGNQTAIAPSVIDESNGNSGSSGDTSNSDAKLDEIFQDGEIPDTDSTVTDSIVNPFANVFTPLNNYNIPIQAGHCPTVDIDYFDPPVNFGMHCTLFEDHKPTFQNAMALIFLISAIRIVLSA